MIFYIYILCRITKKYLHVFLPAFLFKEGRSGAFQRLFDVFFKAYKAVDKRRSKAFETSLIILLIYESHPSIERWDSFRLNHVVLLRSQLVCDETFYQPTYFWMWPQIFSHWRSLNDLNRVHFKDIQAMLDMLADQSIWKRTLSWRWLNFWIIKVRGK